jgi:hypothetical protein
MLDVLTPQLFGWLALVTSFVAPSNPGDAKKVKVTVVVILATDRCQEVDPRLKLIAAEVQKVYPDLKGFTLSSMTCKSLAVDEKSVFALVGDKTAVVVVHQAADPKTNKVSLGVTPPEQGEIVYRTVCGKFLPIVTRCRSCEHISPAYVVRALGSASGPGSAAPAIGACVALSGKARERLILAIRVQPCNGK